MSIEKINFEDLIQDNKLLYKPNYLDIIPNNIAWFGNTIFSNPFSLNNRGLTFRPHSNITTFEKSEDETFRFNFQVQATRYNIKALEFNNCIFHEEPIVKNEAIKFINFYNCTFKCDVYKLLKKYGNLSLEIKFNNCTFEKIDLSIISQDYNVNLFEIYGGEITTFQIYDKTFEKKFYINKQYNNDKNNITKITNLSIKKSTFLENFKLHNCEVNNIPPIQKTSAIKIQ